MRATCTYGLLLGFSFSFALALGLGSVAVSFPAGAAEVGWEQAAEESFWYSLYNVESLLLRSGMGAPLGPSELERVGLSPADLAGYFPLVAPFRVGLPEFAQRPQPERAETLRWRPRAAEQTISLEALAFAVVAELGWAARLEQLLRVQSDSPTLQREVRLLRAMARAASEFAERKLRRSDGLYLNALRWWRDLPLAEGPPPWRGQIAWLWALASLVPRHAEARARADALFRLLDGQVPWGELSARDASLAVQALAWYLYSLQARTQTQPQGQDQTEELGVEAVRRLDELAERLLSLLDADGELGLEDLAALVSGLLYAHHLTGEGRYLREAERAWGRLLTYWREEPGLFLSISGDSEGGELTVEGLAELLGAFHAMIFVAGSEGARQLYARFLEGLKRSGLQRSEGQEAGGSFDGDPVPSVVDAGEPPVLVAAVRYSPETGWQVSDRRFLSAPALHAAVNWLWLGRFRGEGFAGPPAYGLPTSPLALQLHLPRRLSALEEDFPELEQAIARLRTRLDEMEEATGAREQALLNQIRDLERKLLRRLEEGVRTAREEVLKELPPAVDEEALSQRIQERLEERVAETLGPQLAALSEGLRRLEEQLKTLPPPQAQAQVTPEEISRLRAQLNNLIERVSALEERTTARWPLRPEALLLAVIILGLALLVVGVLQLRRLRRT